MTIPETVPGPAQVTDDPPSYESVAIPPSSFTDAFANLSLQPSSGGVTSDVCLAHLKLLEAFAMMRSDISTQDGIFGVWEAQRKTDESKEEARKACEEKRWSIFVMQAVMRFQTWWNKVLEASSPMLNIVDLQKPGWETGFEKARPLLFIAEGSKEDSRGDVYWLPPLDVIMVWHAFMLNPRTYLSDCLRFNKTRAWTTGMPWNAVNAAIDNETFAFIANDSMRAAWETATGYSWEQNTSSTDVSVVCMNCNNGNSVPWTTQFQLGETKSSKSGYADPDFKTNCAKCRFLMTHDTQRMLHFWRDLVSLNNNNVPFPGTILGTRGYPERAQRPGEPLYNRGVEFPNAVMIEKGTGKDIERTIAASRSKHIGATKQNAALTAKAVREYMEYAMKVALKPVPAGRLAIRRTMAAYWENDSIFAMDLVGAVIRQGTFVAKMHDIDWLHSPSARPTMARLIEKYGRFFNIMTGHTQIAVPTLDVDLAWHTEQLSPARYWARCKASTQPRTLIDHDDKIEESALSEAFAWTSKTYFKQYNELYSQCTCWYCEGIHESHRPSGLSALTHKAAARKLDADIAALTHRADPSADPARNVHISAHNAIATRDPGASERQAVHRLWLARQVDRARQRSDKRERKEGRRDPNRATRAAGAEYPYNSAATTPIFPYYAPLAYPGIYVADPGCASFAAGANCCTGTCGAGAASGGCGGAGGCGAGAACGGGAGGGGCGGGGGGGGCGGGG